jgi:hypothetical protein
MASWSPSRVTFSVFTLEGAAEKDRPVSLSVICQQLSVPGDCTLKLKDFSYAESFSIHVPVAVGVNSRMYLSRPRPAATHDDCVDSTTQALNYIRHQPVHPVTFSTVRLYIADPSSMRPARFSGLHPLRRREQVALNQVLTILKFHLMELLSEIDKYPGRGSFSARRALENGSVAGSFIANAQPQELIQPIRGPHQTRGFFKVVSFRIFDLARQSGGTRFGSSSAFKLHRECKGIFRNLGAGTLEFYDSF